MAVLENIGLFSLTPQFYSRDPIGLIMTTLSSARKIYRKKKKKQTSVSDITETNTDRTRGVKRSSKVRHGNTGVFLYTYRPKTVF